MFKRSLMVWMVAAGLASVCLMVGCEAPWDDDDDDSPAGTSTIQGNIESFDLPSAAVVSAAVQAGVTVYLKGTAFSATTADDGTFVISGVPAGDYELVIKYGDSEVVYPIHVPDNAVVVLIDVLVRSNGDVLVRRINVVDLGTGRSTVIVDEGYNDVVDDVKDDGGDDEDDGGDDGGDPQ